MTEFRAKHAADYDQRIPRLVPGYSLATELAAASLTAALPEGAEILVAGCGTGHELVALAEAAPTWRLTGVDSSPDMLRVAERKLDAAGHLRRVTLVAGDIRTVSLPQHDAAVAFLVGHFLPDDGTRLGLLHALRLTLRSAAPLLLLDYEAEGAACEYHAWLTAHGHSRASADGVLGLVNTNWHPLTSKRSTDLLQQAGFTSVMTFFQALGYRGTCAVSSPVATPDAL